MGAPLHIQQASAGSGKTYSLTKAFIRLFISIRPEGKSERRLRNDEELKNSLSHILAVTFTNKATNEMKQRIIKCLADLAKGTGDPEKDSKIQYMNEFVKEFRSNGKEIAEICRKALKLLLLNYSDFNVSTIDSFFQGILRTFAYETDLNDTFNLEIDSDYLAAVSVDSVLDGMVTERNAEAEKLLQLMMGQKSETNQWNVYQRGKNDSSPYQILISNSKRLENEDYKEIRQELEDYFASSPVSISALIDHLRKKYEEPLEKLYKEVHGKILKMEKEYEKHGIGPDKRSKTFTSCLTRAKEKAMDPYTPFTIKTSKTKGISMHSSLQKVSTLKEYPAYVDLDILYNEIGELDGKWKELLSDPQFFIWKLYKYQLAYLGLLNIVSEKKKEYLANSNIVQLSDTNQMLHEIIDDEETPFIYERTGTWINHYLIDEFQDTSEMQWENLRPLLSESIDKDNDNLIIGDAKQSIYRFRNADYTLISKTVPQLYKDRSDWAADPIAKDPLEAEEQKKRLNTNWRSELRIVEFNNYFFRMLANLKAAKKGVDEESYYFTKNIRDLYQNNVQPPSPSAQKKERGYVEINLQLRPPNWKSESEEENSGGFGFDQLGDTIKEMCSRGHSYKDIGILVRTNAQGTQAVEAITKYNLEHPGEEIPFLSDQSLLVERAMSVKLIILALNTISSGNNYDSSKQTGDEKTFDVERLYEIIKERPSLSLTSLIETIIDRLVPEELKVSETPYLAAFQDAVIEFTNNYNSDIASFLQWWERLRDKLAIISPEEAEAVRVITVHKSKGLEYKCVIIPHADFGFIPSKKKEWLWVVPELESDHELPPYIPVEASADLEKTPHREAWENLKELVALDGLNAAYVAFTRAREELHIFASAAMLSNNPDKISYSIEKLCVEWKENMDGTDEPHLLSLPIASKERAMDKAGNVMEISDTADEEGVADPEVSRLLTFTYGEKSTVEGDRKETKNSSEKNKIGRILIEEYTVNSGIENLKFRDEDLKIQEEPEEEDSEKTPEWRKLRDEGVKKHSIMSMIVKESDLGRALTRHKIKGKITTEQAVEWGAELKKALENVRGYGWFAGDLEIMNENTIQLKGHRDSRPDRIMVTPDNDAIVVDYKFGHHTDVEAYRRQVKKYVKLLEETGLFRSVKGYVWYVERGTVEEIRN